jgi:hypothetical protein
MSAVGVCGCHTVCYTPSLHDGPYITKTYPQDSVHVSVFCPNPQDVQLKRDESPNNTISLNVVYKMDDADSMTPLLSMKESTHDQNKGLDNVTNLKLLMCKQKGLARNV